MGRVTAGPALILASAKDARRIAEVHVEARRAAYQTLVSADMLASDTVEGREAQWTRRLADPNGRCWLVIPGNLTIHGSPSIKRGGNP